MTVFGPAAAVLLVVMGDQTGAAAEPPRETHAASDFGVAAPRLTAVRVGTPPVLDGRLDDAVWSLTPGTSGFTQQSPYGGAAPSEPTTVKVLYDAEAIYVGFDCVQTKTALVGHLTRRDEDSESDWVWMHIDSRNDSRAAAFFAVNVAGGLVDGTLHDGTTLSTEWDENWEARSAVTPTGWSAEFRIPLRVLRFSPDIPVQSWGFWASRFVGLLQEKDDWPYISREVAAPIPFFGRLDGLRDLPRGGRVEVRPFALGQLRRREAQSGTSAAGALDANGSAGLDLKLHLTQSLTLDAAVNPDFAQVEADQLILNLNNYEILYPEKRPLFLEGADFFATPLGLFYSRRIGSSPATPTQMSGSGPMLLDLPGAATIYGAAKLVGRVGDSWVLGALSALASRNDYSYGGMTQTLEPLTSYNVLRLRRDIGDRAQIGLIATGTDRFERTGSARTCPSGDVVVAGQRCFRDAGVAGIDGLWRSPDADYLVSGQVVGSVVRGASEIQLDGTPIGSGDRGIGGWARLAKDGGRNFLAELVYTGIGRKLTYNDLGFMPRQNLHEVKAGLELRSLDPGPLTLERHLRLDLSTRRNLDGLDIGSTAELGFTTRLQGFWIIHAAVDVAPAHFDDREVGDGTALERAFSWGGKAELSSDPRRRFSAGFKGELRLLERGTGIDAQATIAIHALPQLQIDIVPQVAYQNGEPRFVHTPDDPAALCTPGCYVFGDLLARSAGATLRAGYTFTPRLSLQTFAQLFLATGHYTNFSDVPAQPGAHVRLADLAPRTEPNPPSFADFEEAALNLNVILRWEYRLGSTLFLVYSRSQIPTVNLASTEPAAFTLSSVGRSPAADVILVKLSFWWAS